MMQRLKAIALTLAASVVLSACTSLPEAEELPQGQGTGEIEVVAAETEAAAEDEIPVQQLRLKDVRGGQIEVELEASAEEVAAALLDFENADGHRAWAPKIEALGQEGDVIRTRWHFEGEMGINPVVVLGFKEMEKSPGRLIRFRILEPDFGLAAFFGDYQIEDIEGEEGRSRLRARIFIDSGVTIANASFDEIAAGLREDAKMLKAWLEERR